MTEFFGCSTLHEEAIPKLDRTSAMETFAILKPKHSPYSLIRIGGNGDGSYLLPNDLVGVDGCLSPGVNNFKHFEDELALKNGIPSDLLDASSDEEAFSTPLIRDLQTFTKKWLDVSGTDNCTSISDWLSTKASHQHDFLLQMDIEGAEYRNILATPIQDLGRFRIIIMELHNIPICFCDPNIFYCVMRPFLAKLDELFVCVHTHPNNVSDAYTPPEIGVMVPRILELTFLRRDRFPQGAPKKNVSLPHPLDITNVVGLPPAHLAEGWLTGTRSLSSKIRIYSDWINYYKHQQSKGHLRKTLQAQIQFLLEQKIERLKDIAGIT